MSTAVRHETRPGLGVRSEGGVVFLTLDRPERRNALSRGLLAEIEGDHHATSRQVIEGGTGGPQGVQARPMSAPGVAFAQQSQR